MPETTKEVKSGDFHKIHCKDCSFNGNLCSKTFDQKIGIVMDIVQDNLLQIYCGNIILPGAFEAVAIAICPSEQTEPVKPLCRILGAIE